MKVTAPEQNEKYARVFFSVSVKSCNVINMGGSRLIAGTWGKLRETKLVHEHDRVMHTHTNWLAHARPDSNWVRAHLFSLFMNQTKWIIWINFSFLLSMFIAYWYVLDFFFSHISSLLCSPNHWGIVHQISRFEPTYFFLPTHEFIELKNTLLELHSIRCSIILNFAGCNKTVIYTKFVWFSYSSSSMRPRAFLELCLTPNLFAADASFFPPRQFFCFFFFASFSCAL